MTPITNAHSNILRKRIGVGTVLYPPRLWVGTVLYPPRLWVGTVPYPTRLGDGTVWEDRGRYLSLDNCHSIDRKTVSVSTFIIIYHFIFLFY